MLKSERVRTMAVAWLGLVPAAGVLAAPGAPLNQLACAAGVHCATGVTPTDAQIVLNLTEAQAQTAFIDASQDWPDTAWGCAAGGRTCGSLSQLDAQTLIGLPEQAYGPAEQLRARGASAETPPTPKAATRLGHRCGDAATCRAGHLPRDSHGRGRRIRGHSAH